MTEPVRRDWCEEHNRGSLAETDGLCPECEARTAQVAKHPNHPVKIAVKAAADALSDLNAFYAIIAICEGGCFHAPSNSAVQRIITICKAESGKRLRDYDREVARATDGSRG